MTEAETPGYEPLTKEDIRDLLMQARDVKHTRRDGYLYVARVQVRLTHGISGFDSDDPEIDERIGALDHCFLAWEQKVGATEAIDEAVVEELNQIINGE